MNSLDLFYIWSATKHKTEVISNFRLHQKGTAHGCLLGFISCADDRNFLIVI